MPQLSDRQHEFGLALLDARRPVPEGLVGPDGLPSPRRFAVYRNNVVAGLIGALSDAFPVVQRIVGDEFFRAMTAFYVTREPPTSPILLTYGAGFADFLEVFPPAKSLPYLADVARIERAWVEAHHSADAAPMDVTPLLQMPPAALGALHFDLVPSVRLVQSDLPALTIWRSNRPGETPLAVDLSQGGEAALILRPASEVIVLSLPPGGPAFFDAILAGASVIQAAARGYAEASCFDFAANLSALMLSGAILGLRGAS